jgi:hypothetical protein
VLCTFFSNIVNGCLSPSFLSFVPTRRFDQFSSGAYLSLSIGLSVLQICGPAGFIAFTTLDGRGYYYWVGIVPVFAMQFTSAQHLGPARSLVCRNVLSWPFGLKF